MKLLLAQAFFMMLIYGCTKPCEVQDGTKGIIVRSIPEQFPCVHILQENFLITNDSQYKAIFYVDSLTSMCKGKQLEFIDFSQFSLLGQQAGVGGCDGGFFKTATRNDNEKKIIYEVDANGCGQCDMYVTSMNLVLIPKVPDDYTAEFILK